MIDLKNYFKQSTEENEQIKFQIRKANIPKEETQQIKSTNPEFEQAFKTVQSFTPRMDAELLRQIDKYWRNKLGSRDILTCKPS